MLYSFTMLNLCEDLINKYVFFEKAKWRNACIR